MSADATYPPLFPFLVAILIPVADSLSALTISALLAKSVLVLAVYWSTRQGSRSAGVVAATLILTAAYQLEAYAFGAYPQLLATGFGVVVVWLALRFISEHRRTYLVLILLGSTMIFATPAQTAQGALEKLKIAQLMLGDCDGALKCWQPDLDTCWIAAIIKDVERSAV